MAPVLSYAGVILVTLVCTLGILRIQSFNCIAGVTSYIRYTLESKSLAFTLESKLQGYVRW
jgi:hypothetical protein